MSYVKKLDLRFLQNKTETFLFSFTHLILRFTIVQNKFQQTNKTKINHINDNHIKFEVSLHFGGICPTVRRPCAAAAVSRMARKLKKLTNLLLLLFYSDTSINTQSCINPNWHEGGHITPPCPFWIPFCQLNIHQKFPNFLGVKIDIKNCP